MKPKIIRTFSYLSSFYLFYRRAFRDKLENQAEREKKGEGPPSPPTCPGFDELKTITKDDIYDYLLRSVYTILEQGMSCRDRVLFRPPPPAAVAGSNNFSK
jgi:hypothetical protein